MAVIDEMINVPVRSISLPSRLQPNSIESELKTIGQLSTSETISTGFTRLANLYNNIEETHQSPHTQQASGHQKNAKLMEEALEDSVALLDACGTVRNLIMTMKEQVQELQSALRRRGGDSSSIGTNILAYISFRKKLNKNIGKSLRLLKRLESKNNNAAFPLLDCHVIKALRESNGVPISMFESLLSFLSMPEMKRKAGGGWSLISKLLPVTAAERSQKLFNEVGIVDFTLYTQVRKSDAKIDAQIQLRRLETLWYTIKGLEAGLDCLFRCLIRNRVSLLNILAP